MLVSAQAIETTSGRHVSCLDLGGGWYPDDWAASLSRAFEERVIQQVTRALPHVRDAIPGARADAGSVEHGAGGASA